MAENYKVANVRVDESQALVRVAELKAGNATYDGLSHSFGPRYSGSSEPEGVQSINEGYLVLTLEQLRELDHDPEKQDAYIRRQLRSPDAGRLNILFVNLVLGNGAVVTSKDVEYLNDLLMWGQNHLYVVPTVTFPDGVEPQARLDRYEGFVKDLLGVKNGTVSGKLRVGVTVPSFYGHGSVRGLLERYGKEDEVPAFVAMDFQNSRVGKLSIGQKVAFVHRYFKTEEKTDRYFVYALRAKGRKRGECPAPAEDLATMLAGINAIGGPHNLAPGGGAYPFTWQALVGLSRESHIYDRVASTPKIRSAFLKFIKEKTTVPPPNFSGLAAEDDVKFVTHVRNFNRRMLNTEGSELSTEVTESDSGALKKRLGGKPSVDIAKRAIGG
jgi:hypothetical protein